MRRRRAPCGVGRAAPAHGGARDDGDMTQTTETEVNGLTTSTTSTSTTSTKPLDGHQPQGGAGFGRVAAIYLLGLLLGGLYVGLIAPVRTVIQAQMGVSDAVGIWMVNVYTLFYAALIPISGALADRHGRKRVFSACLVLFAAGSAVCGLSQDVGGFGMLLAGRVVQAAGAGGIIPVATAEMGASAPAGSRGMWLGIASAVAGISNVVGSAAGSAIIGVVGVQGWRWAFYVAVPVGVALAVCARSWLPDHHEQASGRLDLAGSALFVAFVLLALVGIGGIDFFRLGSLASPRVWGALAAAAVVLVAFRGVERRADSPIFHVEYLRDRQIRIIMAVSFFVGCCIISMVLVPQFAEYALGLPVGSGGYYMAVMGVFAAFGPPLGGRIIDAHGAKPVLVGGLIVTAVGFVLLATLVAGSPSPVAMFVALLVVGLGMGFTMGTPLNYMMLQCTPPEQSSSAIATLALVRQIGTTVAPALLVGFISHGSGMAGYQAMLLTVAAFNVVSLALVLRYRDPRARARAQRP